MTIAQGPSHDRTDTVVHLPPPVVPDIDPTGGRVVVREPLAPSRQVRTAYTSRFAPDAVIAALVGLAGLLTGLIAVIRGGFDGPMSEPVIKVLGFTHTTTLGLVEIALGAALLISGATRSRSGAVLFGSVLGIAGFVGAVQSTSFHRSLALQSSMAWLAVLAALAVVLSALLLPRFARRSTTIEQN
jgi:hypothetical protein